MKISLITATYNSYPAINDCIASIANQTAKPEHLVIDGGSNDKTLETVKTAKIIAKYISEPDKGIYDALNKGIQMASGDIIGVLHSDDLLASDTILEKIALTFEETGADVLYGDLVYVDKEDTSKVIRFWKSQPFKTELLKRGWMPAHPTVFAKREVYQKHGLFDLSFKIAADYDLMLRIFKDSSLKYTYLPEVITRMRVGGASNKSVSNIIQKSKEDYRAMKKNGLGFPAWTLFCKNLSKIPQFFKR
ncbi:glycosyltransferase family 2 protein [Mangrovibacterium diazotrophicum]|uniref:Glycosyltransferase n=1 Tax=Mangrovibacterium diazotrophicum TaxID=1261403 RepID=A0A419W5N8_9BACT|nr:glycosyltransferase family 2 protein [Mangrovibacterium diazotrophicum]RKD90778.1 glycosyltransferase [Mangrovibacterium diazotrophicum]